ncbi:hypothetical protein M501DRAFT_1058742 [Patellaria atrata CBS 101060]|uniref:Uncharacterized protein n=1 Tax=Patellaria atrata CBS 101060 TaxID=1346257 RepID=A0A9P4VRT0_9PEZI|nr:hypothetical protein M501DRAFT_1058742 [Patellaria atrata CBS 101060]
MASILSDGKVKILETVLSTVSSASLLCTLALLFTFFHAAGYKQKPINRMHMWASWANILANVATVTSVSGIAAGEYSPTRRAQATMIQWFVPADLHWAFRIALNVHGTFKNWLDAEQMRRREIWVFILLTMGIYLQTGRHMFNQRTLLQSFGRNELGSRIRPSLFLGQLVVWIPSTAHRAQSLATTGEPSYGLSVAAALVLPAQGVCNAVLYFVANRNLVRGAWGRVFEPRGRTGDAAGSTGRMELVALPAAARNRGVARPQLAEEEVDAHDGDACSSTVNLTYPPRSYR